MMKKAIWLATTAVIGVASPSLAQTQEKTSSSPQNAGIADIVVTANRIDQAAQTTPLSIAVVGGEELAKSGVTQAQDLMRAIPGLTVSFGGATSQTYIRGVGSFTTDASAEGSIAYNINGVYISRPGGIGPIFFDLDRVEVLKGPQGTLYGRNATGGAINLITARPKFKTEGFASLEAGNYDLVRLTSAINVPVGDTLALRGAMQITHRNGYLSDGYDDQESQAFRLTGLYEPSDKLSLLVTGEYTHVGGQGAGVVRRSAIGYNPTDHWLGVSDDPRQQPQSAQSGGTRVLDDGHTNVRVYAISANLDADLGFAKLTFVPAYRRTEPSSLGYTAGFRYDTGEKGDQQSYELRLSNQSDLIKWTAGIYYFDESQREHYTLDARPFQANVQDRTLSTKSYAAFGEATVSVSDAFRLIGGLRYSRDKKTQDGLAGNLAPTLNGLPVESLPVVSTTSNFGRATFKNTSWKGGFEFDVAPSSLLYGTVSRGFKAGGFVPSVLFPDNIYQPEILTAYTLAMKNRFLNNTLQLNIEGFYWDYKDKQERYLGLTSTGASVLRTTNAGAATLYGANVDLVWKPAPADTIRINGEYLHTKYDSFVYTLFNPRAPTPAEAQSCSIGAPVPYTPTASPLDSTQVVDCSGKSLVRAPKWSASASYDHRFDLANGSSINAGADVQYSSSQYLTPDFIRSAYDDGYALVGANVTWTAADGNFSVSVWGRNLTNENIYSGAFRYPFALPTAFGGDPSAAYNKIRDPRTYGVTVRGSF